MSYTPQDKISITSAIGVNSDNVISGGNWSVDTYTGSGEENDYAYVGVNLQVDEAGTLYFDFSQDGTNWSTYPVNGFSVSSGINEVHTAWKGGRYMRPRFVGSGGRSYFRLKTYYSNLPLPLSAPINQSITNDQDATLVRTTDYKYEVAMGKRSGKSTINKWGYNLDIDTGTEEIITPWGGAFNPITNIMDTAQTFTITYNNTTDGSGQVGALMLLISYLDANNDLAEAYHTLGSTGTDVTAFTGLGINRVVVISNGGIGWNVNDITFTATSDTTIQAQVPALKGVTQQCIYHTPKNFNLLTDWMRGNVLKISGGGGSPIVTVVGYSWSRVTNTRYEVFREDIDTGVENHLDIKPSQPFVIGGREVLYFTASTTVNNTSMKLRFSGSLEQII